MQKSLKRKKLGAFIVPTGIGASIGGYAGDASAWARKFAEVSTIIVNPNVVNAGGFSGITDNMFYVEGYSLNEFFKGKISLEFPQKNKIGVVFDKNISDEVLNIHINTINAVKTVYDIDIIFEITQEPAGLDFFVDKSGISTGEVSNIETILYTAKNLLKKGADTIAVVCRFKDDYEDDRYKNGIGVDAVGGLEAVISHYLSKELKVPSAHAPAFEDFSITTEIVNPKVSPEYITPTFLPCILIGLSMAPRILPTNKKQTSKKLIDISDLDFLIMPYNSLGCIPIFEAVKRGIKIFAVKENKSVLNVTKKALCIDCITELNSYRECLEIIKS